MASSSSLPPPPDRKMIKLRSSDEEEFEVEEVVAVQSQTIRHMVEDGFTDDVIPIPKVEGKILAKVIEYCKKHSDQANAEELKSFDADFVKDADYALLFELIRAANFLDIKNLMDLLCQTAADRIKDKSPEEVRLIFNIENDFTPEEEEAVRRENQWAFE